MSVEPIFDPPAPEEEGKQAESTTHDLRARLERLLRYMLLAFVLAGVGFLSAVTAIRIAIRGRIVTMPNLVGTSFAEAQTMIGARGLRLSVADRVYDQLPVNSVVRQSPPPGEEMKVSQEGHVILSLGPQLVKTPALEGMSLRAARIALLQAGLQLGEVSSIELPGAQPDTVLRQSPPPGGTAASPHVDLLVAAAVETPYYVMPAVVGLDQQEANRVLMAAGLKISKVNHVSQSGATKGIVIGQTPPRGERIPGDATVELGIAD